jgi:hypothetical protein
MDHKQALETMAVEKYLLDEFDSGEREAFEEHYFSCRDCAEDLTAAAALLERGKELFARDPMSVVERAPQTTPTPGLHEGSPRKPGLSEHKDWFAWLRPAIAIPALALLLLVIGVQNFYQLPALEEAKNAPAVLPSAYLPSGSTRGDQQAVDARPGEDFLLTIDISGDGHAARTVELYDVAGLKKWSLAVPENTPPGAVSLKMPGTLPAGSYSLVVKQAGESGPGNRYQFTLQRQ